MRTVTVKKGSLGARIMDFRKSGKLTQSDLAERYHVSGPAIFKFEKGFVTPSLKLWEVIANDIGIPEREAVLLWVKEKLPNKMHNLIRISSSLDIKALALELDVIGKGKDSQKKLRQAILQNYEIAPALKKFVAQAEMWKVFKPTAKELKFLIEVDQVLPNLSITQYRDLMLVAREIENPTD